MTDRNVDAGRVIRDEGVGRLATLTGDVAEDLQRPVKPFYAGIFIFMSNDFGKCKMFYLPKADVPEHFLFFKNIRCWILHLVCKGGMGFLSNSLKFIIQTRSQII